MKGKARRAPEMVGRALGLAARPTGACWCPCSLRGVGGGEGGGLCGYGAVTAHEPKTQPISDVSSTTAKAPLVPAPSCPGWGRPERLLFEGTILKVSAVAPASCWS